MSVPTLTGITQIDSADTTTNWSAYGTNKNKHAASNEVYLEGSGSNRIIFNTGNGDGQLLFQTASAINFTTNLFLIWIYAVSDKQFDPWDQVPSGIYVRLGSTAGSNADYNDYYVGGGDIAWCGRGWHLVVVDANRTADRSSGTPDMTSVRMCGVGYANTGVTATQAPSLFVDNPMYGNSVEVTGPSHTDGTNGIDINSGGTIDRNDGGSFVTDGWEVGDYVKIKGSATASNDGVYEITAVATSVLTTSASFTQDTANTTAKIFCSVTLEDIYQKDGPTDDNWWGVVSKDISGSYIINYPLILGDESGGGDLFFLSRGELVTLADQAVDITREDFIKTVEDTGETHVLIGDSNDTGDDRVGFIGSTFTRQETIFSHSTSTGSANTPALVGIDFSANITSLEIYGSTFADIDVPTQAVKFGTSTTTHYITNCTFSACGQVDLGDVEARNLLFTNYTSDTDAALLWNNNIDIKNSRFLANVNSSSDATAIEHPTAGTYAYYGLFFAGNDYDIDFSAASGDLTINANKTTKSGCNPSTYEVTGGGNTPTINNTVTLKVTCKDTNNNPIAGIRVRIEKQSDNSLISNGETNSSGEYIDSTYNYPGSDVDVNYICRLKGYENFKSVSVITSDGLDAGVLMIKDNAINLP